MISHYNYNLPQGKMAVVTKCSSKTKDMAGTGITGNRIVVCLDDTSGIIADSLCSTILIAIQSKTFGEGILPNHPL